MTTSPKRSLLDARWDHKHLKDGEAMLWRLDETSIWVQRISDDWLVASEFSTAAPSYFAFEKVSFVPISVSWTRWAAMTDSDSVRFSPTFPDRSLVVKTRSAVLIPPARSINLYINLPVWVDLSLDTTPLPSSLGVFPTSILSNTWFGSQFAGELCYALKSLATRSKDDLPVDSRAATCRFTIHNQSEEPLPLDRVRVQPRHLSIFKSHRRLWTSAIKVVFHGTDQPSRLEYSDQAPDEAGAKVLLKPPLEIYRSHYFSESIAHYTRTLFE